MIEQIMHGDSLLAIVVRAQFTCDGIEFFTPDDFSQQLGYMCHPKGKLIDPHTHNQVERSISLTQEVLFIRRGRLRVDFYADDHEYVRSIELGAGDVILLASGGHGFEVLEELEMFEVKHGPHAGSADKTRFDRPAFEPRFED